MQALTRSEWGSEAQERLTELKGFLDGLPDGLGEAFVDARTSDGRRLIDNPQWPLMMSDLLRGAVSQRSGPAEKVAKINAVLKRDPQKYFAQGLDRKAVELRKQLEGSREEAEVRGERQPATRREKELQDLLRTDPARTDPARYFKSGGSEELLAIRRARATRGGSNV
jgi:hypothetical protein